jgi:hypothetical protein
MITITTEALAKNSTISASKGSSQLYNPVTGNYILRDGVSGKLTKISHGKPFRGIRKESQQADLVYLPVPKRIALKAERAVIALFNGDI